MQILIVEDHDMLLEITTVILESGGYETLAATDAKTGFEMALEHEPDLIITDHHLMGTNGAEMIQQIRATDAIKDIPIIALTADIYSRQELMDAGCNVHLTKPVRRGSLLNKVKQLLTAGKTESV